MSGRLQPLFERELVPSRSRRGISWTWCIATGSSDAYADVLNTCIEPMVFAYVSNRMENVDVSIDARPRRGFCDRADLSRQLFAPRVGAGKDGEVGRVRRKGRSPRAWATFTRAQVSSTSEQRLQTQSMQIR